ncbi:MAG: reductive dehalogenase domain-containing protein [Candidatus Aminicenantales bacterium]
MIKEAENKETLREFSRHIGIDLFGVADITEIRSEFRFKKELRDSFHRAVVFGKRVLESVLDDIDDRPTPLYFHHYRQLNFFLDRAAFLLAVFIRDQGFRALPIPASQVINWEKQQAHLSHKKIGRLAGLGWIGRNNLLIHPEFGSQFRLVTVLTDMPLEPDQASAGDCRSCFRCLASCPAGAIKARPEDFDHLACFEKLKEFRRSGLVGQFICGVCVKACRRPLDLI